MDMEKLTERARGFVQAAQTIAIREQNQQLETQHLLKALLDDREGLAASLLTAADPASALASLGQVDCRAILAAPSTLAAMREGAAAKQPRPAFVALTETGDSPSDTAADYWHPLPINPRQLARILRELTHGN